MICLCDPGVYILENTTPPRGKKYQQMSCGEKNVKRERENRGKCKRKRKKREREKEKVM